MDTDTARHELLLPVLGGSVISQLGAEFGLKAAQTATREFVVRFINQRGLRVMNAVLTRVFGRRVTQRALITKTVPLVGCVIGGAWNAVEAEVIRNRTLRYLTDQSLDPVEVVNVEVVEG